MLGSTHSGKKILIDEQLKNPRGIAVHPSMGQIFWTDWERSYPRIETSNMDGSNRYESCHTNFQFHEKLTF